jgi:hypothetical protein
LLAVLKRRKGFVALGLSPANSQTPSWPLGMALVLETVEDPVWKGRSAIIFPVSDSWLNSIIFLCRPLKMKIAPFMDTPPAR